MDKRINYLIGLDTETCNGFCMEDGKLDLTQSLVYDIGWAVTDKRGNIYKTRSFVVADIFSNLTVDHLSYSSAKVISLSNTRGFL